MYDLNKNMALNLSATCHQNFNATTFTRDLETSGRHDVTSHDTPPVSERVGRGRRCHGDYEWIV